MMLGPQPLGGLTQQTGWYQREVSSDADIVAFCSLVGDPARVAELVAGVREVVSSVRFGCTLFAVRSLSKSELADVATTPGECPEDATLPLRLFVSAPTTGKAKSGMHTAMLVATFNRAKRGRVVAQTAPLDERCATHSRGLGECVEERKREGKLGCDADKVCIGHAASTRALLSRAAPRVAHLASGQPPCRWLPPAMLRAQGGARNERGAGGEPCAALHGRSRRAAD